MTPVIRNLPLRSLDASQANDMSPAEVTAWLDARERQLRRQMGWTLLRIAFWAIVAGVATIELLTTINIFTH